MHGRPSNPYTPCAVLGEPRIASTVKLACTQVTLTAAAHQTVSLVVPAWVEIARPIACCDGAPTWGIRCAARHDGALGVVKCNVARGPAA